MQELDIQDYYRRNNFLGGGGARPRPPRGAYNHGVTHRLMQPYKPSLPDLPTLLGSRPTCCCSYKYKFGQRVLSQNSEQSCPASHIPAAAGSRFLLTLATREPSAG
ncbi:hypothetical protein E2C01_028081 [Portunus trituberculatus]|uniref:Uncharacterized protein n=1 Tax=Portunus trituberculatus TaxID=210409 RepID=A0A5B7EP39_PORTR|nr:hypothetical protein [Portunus trituberculatus]